MTNKKILPNFLIIGAAKSGTTSLYYYLKEHPQIYMPEGKKEPHFFVLEGKKITDFHHSYKNLFSYSVTTLEEYYHLFEGVTNELAIGEASARYLYHQEAIDNIKKYVPNVKLIAMLRNPVDRAYSQYCHHRRIKLENIENFSSAIALEEKRIKEGWDSGFHYVNRGFYYQQLSKFYEKFNPEQIKVIFYEELINDPIKLSQSIYEFLNVDPNFVTPNVEKKYNQGYLPANKNLYSILKKTGNLGKNLVPSNLYSSLKSSIKNRLSPLFKQKIPKLKEEDRKNLIEIYKEDILSLEKLLNKDLSHWLT